MATNTPKLGLVKPEMSDYADIRVLNGNMDILDSAVGGLDYVKDVTKSDTGLTFTKKDDTEISVPLDYLPITGGNLTGDLTIQGKPLYRLVHEYSESTDNYTQVVRQYEDGTQTINIHSKVKTANLTMSITYLQPFVDDTTTGTYALDTDVKADLIHYDWFYPIYITKTECGFINGSTKGKAYTSIVLTGRWK